MTGAEELAGVVTELVHHHGPADLELLHARLRRSNRLHDAIEVGTAALIAVGQGQLKASPSGMLHRAGQPAPAVNGTREEPPAAVA